MSILNIADTFKRRVRVQIPAKTEKGVDVMTTIEYVAEYHQREVEELAQKQQQLVDGEITINEYVDYICAGCSELKQADGAELSPSAGLAELKRYSPTRQSIIRGFNESQTGDVKAKNSK